MALITVAALAGCESVAPGPLPTDEPTQFRAGTWQTATSGARHVLVLSFIGDSTFGTEQEYSASGVLSASGTVTGYSSGPDIWLAIHYADGELGSFVGRLTTVDTADGVWAITTPLSSFPLRFGRAAN